MRKSGQILRDVIQHVVKYTTPGMSTKQIADEAGRRLATYKNAKPAFLGLYGFPHVMCVSVNEQIIHGIPRSTKIIKDGDVVSIDFGVNYKGMITDSARTYVVGTTNSSKKLLIDKTEQALLTGISVVKNSTTINKISINIEQILSQAKLGIVRDYVGHGVGHELHEAPDIPNYSLSKASNNFILKSGMTIAIEPMAMLGDEAVYTEGDGWTVATSDGSLAAHFEDTVLVTDNGYEILTR